MTVTWVLLIFTHRNRFFNIIRVTRGYLSRLRLRRIRFQVFERFREIFKLFRVITFKDGTLALSSSFLLQILDLNLNNL